MARAASKPQAGLSTAVSLAITVGALYFAQEVLIPIALSVLLAFLLAPLVTRLQRARLPRVPSVLAVVAVAFIVILSISYVVGQQVYGLAESLPQYQEIPRKMASLRGHGSGIGDWFAKLSKEYAKATGEPATQPVKHNGVVDSAEQEVSSDPTRSLALEKANAAPTTAPAPLGSTQDNPIFAVALPAPVSPVKTLGQYMGLVLGPLGTAAVVLVFVVFMLLEREDLRDRLIRLVSHNRYTVTTRAIDDAAGRISRYMLAQSMVNGSYGVVIGTGLFLIGLTVGHGVMFPSFVLWGLLSGALRFIPYIGAWIAASFPILLSLAVYPGFGVFVAVLVLLVGIELITNNVMEPLLYSSSTGLSTMAILIAAVFWTWLWGPVGLLLSTPLTVCVVVLGKHVTRLKFLDVLLGDQAALPPAVSFYQRLLASDRIDAISVAKLVAKERGAERVADEVLIPTMLMAKRDRKNNDLSAENENKLLDELKLVLPELRTDGPKIEDGGTLRVLGVPAHQRSEELVLEMLGDVIAPQSVQVDVLSTRLLPSEIEKQIQRDRPGALFIAVTPPGGTVQARYLCRRIHRKFPELKIIVGYWGKPKSFDELLTRFRNAGASYVTTSVLQSRSQILAVLSRTKIAQLPPTVLPPTPEATTAAEPTPQTDVVPT